MRRVLNLTLKETSALRDAAGATIAFGAKVEVEAVAGELADHGVAAAVVQIAGLEGADIFDLLDRE